MAHELLRVCRSGGTIGMLDFRPAGAAAELFGLFGRHAPPADGPPPVRWGDEDHVRSLLGGGTDLTLTRRSYVERVDGGPAGYVELFTQTFGPAIALRSEAFDREFLEVAARHWRDGGIVYEYLLVRAVRR